MRRPRFLWVMSLCALAASTLLLRADAPFLFVDVSAERGFGPYSATPGMGSGVATADFDDDGLLDVFVPTSPGVADQLYRNIGGGFFEEIAEEAGLASTEGNRAALWLDYDGDGDLDLLTANDVVGAASTYRLYRQRSPGRFEDVTQAAGLRIPLPPPAGDGVAAHRGGMAAGDLDGDGYLDIYAALWNGPSHLLLNSADGTFTDITQSSGIGVAFPYAWQPVMADFNGDGRQDIYVAIDFLWNALFINQGDATFVDLAPAAGADNAMNDMGVAIADYDNDCDLDLYVTNIFSPGQYNILLRNDSQGGGIAFTETAEALGIDDGGWGWGATFLDADNDGLLDLAATNGWYTPMFLDDTSRFFRRSAAEQPFEDVSAEVGFDDSFWGSSLVALDFDREGDPDLLQTCNLGGPLRLLENRFAGPGAPNRYFVVQPRMSGPNHFAIGAIVRVSVEGREQTRLITAGVSFMGQEPAEACFGVGKAQTIDRVTIQWPDGRMTTIEKVQPNQVLRVEIDAAPPELGDSASLTTPRDAEAVDQDGSGWESNPPGAAKQRLNGFEGRGAHQEP